MKPVDLSANIEVLKEKTKDNVKANPIKPITHKENEREKRKTEISDFKERHLASKRGKKTIEFSATSV